MAIHFMKLNFEAFDKIKDGSKMYEFRLYDERRRQIKIGDIIEFTKLNTAEKCTVRVKDLCRFDSFAELYAVLPLQQCGYTHDDLEKAS